MYRKTYVFLLMTVLAVMALGAVSLVGALDDAPEAPITNDEGGPVSITGSVSYTNSFFTAGVAEPVIILEDQAGFIDRNKGFLMPVESQVLGQITSDFFTSPFTYSLTLPIEPRGTLRDVDHDDVEETGVMVFAVAYWTNIFGDPYLEERDLFGGGWSTAYASTHVKQNPTGGGEYIGGKVLIYAPEEGQGFPSGFGEDGLLFTEDDPIVIVPQGYTLVDMDTDPFTFDRSRHPVVDLIEGEGAEADDFSDLSYTEAFDALVDLMSKEYAFTEFKGIDWDALREEFRPMFEEAEANNSNDDYKRALMRFTWAIPDGHVGTSAFVVDDFFFETDGGLGMAIRELTDGRVIVNFLLDGGPAAEAGMELGTEIIALNGVPIAEAIDNTVPWSSPFSADHVRRLQQLRYVIRWPVDTEVEVTFKNPGDDEEQTATLTTIAERESFSFSSFNAGLSGFELPLEYEVLDSGYMYVKIYSFFDNELLTVQLWERMIDAMNAEGVPGLIIDMRQNGGGSGWLADQMAAYFFNEPYELGNTGYYDEEIDDFFFDENRMERFYLPPEDKRYNGPVAVIVGPACASACEFFSYDMTVADRAAIVGHYPTAGLGGSVKQVFMPDGEIIQYTFGRAVDAEGNIHIEGSGVEPTVVVPVTEETLFSDGDPLLDAAVAHLDGATSINIIEGDELAIGDSVTGTLEAGSRAHHAFNTGEGGIVNIVITSDIGAFVDILSPEGDVLASGTSPDDPGWEELELPPDFPLVLEVRTEGDAGAGEYTLSIEPLDE